jgi:hypothetical protein
MYYSIFQGGPFLCILKMSVAKGGGASLSGAVFWHRAGYRRTEKRIYEMKTRKEYHGRKKEMRVL